MVERFASEQGGSLHTVSPDCRAVCEQFVRAYDYDVLVAKLTQAVELLRETSPALHLCFPACDTNHLSDAW